MLMRLNESEALTSTLRNRQDHLMEQIKTLRSKYGNTNVQSQEEIDFNFKHAKSRSLLAIFSTTNRDVFD